ncbi:MAG: CheR family methyltransferase [Candidatus Dormibacterales bacterium]
MSALLSPGLSDVCRLTQARTGLRITGPGRAANLIRLEGARGAAGCLDWPAFAERLRGESLAGHAWTALIRSMTVGETYFFRNKPHFDLLRERVLPALIEQRHREEHPWLRIWSAGCATGEEAYSLAILVRELIPDPERWAILILGTDLNSESLRRARSGSYGLWSFRDTDLVLMSRYTTPHGDRMVVTDEIRTMVTFSMLNLVDADTYGPGASAMDLILCRNVTMYFGQPTAEVVAKRLLSALTPGGWLLVGPSEPDAQVFAGFDVVNAYETTAYRRPQHRVESAKIEATEPASAGTRPVVLSAEESFGVPVSGASRSLSPTTPEECLRAARTAGDAGRYEEGRDWCCRALDLDPTDADAHHLLGTICAAQHQTEFAVKAFRKAIYLDRDFALAHYGLSNELRILGDETGAERSVETARRLLCLLPAHGPLRGSHGMTAREMQDLLEPDVEGLPA